MKNIFICQKMYCPKQVKIALTKYSQRRPLSFVNMFFIYLEQSLKKKYIYFYIFINLRSRCDQSFTNLAQQMNILYSENKRVNHLVLKPYCPYVPLFYPHQLRDSVSQKILPNSRFKIFPLIENLEWPYIWGVVWLFVRLFGCLYAIVGRSVGRIDHVVTERVEYHEIAFLCRSLKVLKGNGS